MYDFLIVKYNKKISISTYFKTVKRLLKQVTGNEAKLSELVSNKHLKYFLGSVTERNTLKIKLFTLQWNPDVKDTLKAFIGEEFPGNNPFYKNNEIKTLCQQNLILSITKSIKLLYK